MKSLQLATLIYLSYAIVAVNTIAISKMKYVPTIVSSIAFMLVNFFLIKKVTEATTLVELIAYIIGGVAGDVTGIYLSKWWSSKEQHGKLGE